MQAAVLVTGLNIASHLYAALCAVIWAQWLPDHIKLTMHT